MIEKGRAIEKYVFDPKETEGMTKEECNEYYRKKFARLERERLEKERS